MANAQTEHSRRLRAKTAMEWKAKKIKDGEIGQIQLYGKKSDIDAMKEGLESIDGTSWLNKCLFLLDFYKKATKSQ